MLAMLGFNILALWLLGKRVVMRRHPRLAQTRVGAWVANLSLETQLKAGALLFFAGVGTDSWILMRWLQNIGAPMESTVHPAFVATSVVEMGLTLMFNAFVLNLVVCENSTS